MAIYGDFIVFYGLLWQNIDLIVFVSSLLAVIDPNSFGLILRCIFNDLEAKANSDCSESLIS